MNMGLILQYLTIMGNLVIGLTLQLLGKYIFLILQARKTCRSEICFVGDGLSCGNLFFVMILLKINN
jgi:hypothetical protein